MTHQYMEIKIKELEKRIKALEQEPVLDKIRAEIEEVVVYDGIYISRSYVLGILDKYRAESEDNDRNCESCKHHHDGGCDSWECEEEAEG